MGCFLVHIVNVETYFFCLSKNKGGKFGVLPRRSVGMEAVPYFPELEPDMKALCFTV